MRMAFTVTGCGPRPVVRSSGKCGRRVSMAMDRREFLVTSGSTLAGIGMGFPEAKVDASVTEVAAEAAVAQPAIQLAAVASEFQLPPLPYPYDALEPYIDEATMRLHHDRHYQAYTNKLNSVLPSVEGIKSPTLSDLESTLSHLDDVKDSAVKATLRNNGDYNHTVYFETMSKDGMHQPTGQLAADIKERFGSFEEFKAEFTKVATGVFGSGWAWLYRDGKTGKLEVKGYPNQDSPLLEGHKPILGCDVWEHAYYLRYNNRRPEYVEAFWNVVNWDAVSARL